MIKCVQSEIIPFNHITLRRRRVVQPALADFGMCTNCLPKDPFIQYVNQKIVAGLIVILSPPIGISGLSIPGRWTFWTERGHI